MQPIEPPQLPDALARLLADPATGRRADTRQVRGFMAYLERCPLRWRGWFSRRGDSSASSVLVLLVPGHTATLLIPPPGNDPAAIADQVALTNFALGELRAERLHYCQSLLARSGTAQRSLLESVGFRFLAPLIYMERDAKFPWVAPPDVAVEAWVSFSEATHELFARTMTETYEDSLDCPELSGLRPIDDVIAAHKSSGLFEPRHWEVLLVDDAPAGCLLLSKLPHSGAQEVVYMGVTPRSRGRGVGDMLMRRAVQRCRETGAPRLTLVVDGRNDPAQRVYARFGLKPIAERDALYFTFGAPR